MANYKWINVCLFGAMLVFSKPVCAQTPYLNVQGSNFDLWCQEHMKLPPERCDKRSQEDNNAYETYRDKIDDFEETLRLNQQKSEELDRTILNNDPIDDPEGQNPATQSTARPLSPE